MEKQRPAAGGPKLARSAPGTCIFLLGASERQRESVSGARSPVRAPKESPARCAQAHRRRRSDLATGGRPKGSLAQASSAQLGSAQVNCIQLGAAFGGRGAIIKLLLSARNLHNERPIMQTHTLARAPPTRSNKIK